MNNKWPDTSKSKYYPFNDIMDIGFKYVIINGIINDGKTYGAKEWALNYHLETGKKIVYLFNSHSNLSDTVDEFTNSNVENNPEWERFTTKQISMNKWKGYIDDKEAFVYRLITSKDRGERDGKNIGAIIYDEFNLIDSRVRNIQLRNFKNLLTRSFEFLDYMILIGNAVTLNNPILFDLGIMEIKDEFTEFEIYDTGMFGLFHNFKRPKEDVMKKYEGNIFAAYLMGGEFGKHAFENQFLLDDMNNIVDIPEKILKKYGELKDVFKWESKYVLHYKYNENDKVVSYFMIKDKIDGKERMKYNFALDRDNLDEGIKFWMNKLITIGRYIQTDRAFYQNVASKQIIRKAIKTHLRW